MSQPYTISEFSQYVTDDFNWRVKEISDLKKVIQLSGATYSSVARKAALTLIYAHWEGHVHFVTVAFLKFIARKKIKFGKLIPSFQAVKMTSHMTEWQNQKDSIILRLKIINTVRALEVEQFRVVPNNAVHTAGNLNFERLLNICQIMMVDADKIVPDRDFLDAEVVGARNRIAHGDSLIVTEDQLAKIIDFALEIMRCFRTEVENSVVLKSYEKVPA